MTEDRERILAGLSDAVVDMDEDRAVELAHEVLALGLDPYEAIMSGLSAGMDIVSEKYDNEEYFVPEILLCSDAMYSAIAILKPHVKVEELGVTGRIVIGVVEGDTHDIGKNIVRIMLEAAGFEVHDLGRNVPVERFVSAAQETKADVVALSTLMSTTRDGMRRVAEGLRAAGLGETVKIIIGGPPVSWAYCREIGAAAYGNSAVEGVRLVRALLAGEAL